MARLAYLQDSRQSRCHGCSGIREPSGRLVDIGPIYGILPSHGAVLQGLERWERSGEPYTTHSALHTLPAASLQAMPLPGAAASAPFGGAGAQGASLSALGALPPQAAAALRAVLGAQRGLLVVGELTHPDDVVAAAQLARALRWPVAADVLSGEDQGLPVRRRRLVRGRGSMAWWHAALLHGYVGASQAAPCTCSQSQPQKSTGLDMYTP
jgi:hypothetical protein